jgi:RNA polymerase sigma-70 factor (ECF subfamily)
MLRIKNRTTSDEDALLISSCKQGDINAFESLVHKYQKRMFNIAFRIIGDYEDAGEAVQEAFLSAYRGIGKFRGDATFLTWLTAITVNLAKNRLKQVRGRRHQEIYSLDDPIQTNEGCMAVDPPSNVPSVQDQLEQHDIRQKLQECISVLETDFREVLVLRDMQEFSYEEISSMLKIALGTVKSRLSRARETIRDCLKRKLGDLL